MLGEGKPAGRREKKSVVEESEERLADITIWFETHLSHNQDLEKDLTTQSSYPKESSPKAQRSPKRSPLLCGTGNMWGPCDSA